jgi:Cu-Zn family superoxide dismutase
MVTERRTIVKRNLTLILGILFMISFPTSSRAAEMDEGSMEESMHEYETEPIVDEGNANEIDAMEEIEIIAEEPIKEVDSSDSGVPYTARAFIKATQPESLLNGTVDFIETGDGIQVVAVFSNVTPAGKHGFHVHENGSCEDGGNAAGGHFNPAGMQHGFLPKDGHDKAHAGDLGNIEIDDAGNGTLVVFVPGLSLSKGEKNISGKAVILHEKEDDFGQPTGNAGGRIGCGLIVVNE